VTVEGKVGSVNLEIADPLEQLERKETADHRDRVDPLVNQENEVELEMLETGDHLDLTDPWDHQVTSLIH